MDLTEIETQVIEVEYFYQMGFLGKTIYMEKKFEVGMVNM